MKIKMYLFHVYRIFKIEDNITKLRIKLTSSFFVHIQYIYPSFYKWHIILLSCNSYFDFILNLTYSFWSILKISMNREILLQKKPATHHGYNINLIYFSLIAPTTSRTCIISILFLNTFFNVPDWIIIQDIIQNVMKYNIDYNNNKYKCFFKFIIVL